MYHVRPLRASDGHCSEDVLLVNRLRRHLIVRLQLRTRMAVSLEAVSVEEHARAPLVTPLYRAREAARPEVGLETAVGVRSHVHFVVAALVGLAQAQPTVTGIEDIEPENSAQSFGLKILLTDLP